MEGKKGVEIPPIKVDKVRSGSVSRFEILKLAEDGIDDGGFEILE